MKVELKPVELKPVMDIKEYLKKNLSIQIDETTEFGPIKKVTVKIELEGDIIAESSYYPSYD